MKSTYLLFLVFLIGTITPALAQEKMVARDGFKEGYRAVQFGIGNNFTLTNFGNASLNFMRFDSEKKARFIRGYLVNSISSSNEDSDFNGFVYEDEVVIDTLFSKSEEEGKNYDTELRIYLGIINYLPSNSDILPFFSQSIYAGNRFRSSPRSITKTNEPDSDPYETIDYNTKNFSPSIGYTARFGVDYFIAKNISVNAQFGGTLFYRFTLEKYEFASDLKQSDQIEYEHLRDRTKKKHDVSLQSAGILFGLTAYF